MRHACALGLLVGAIVAIATPVGRAAQRPTDVRPQTIFWPQAPGNPNRPTPVGLLYTPEVLAALAAAAPESVSARIVQAIRQQTPLVVLWTIPPPANADPWPRPFSTVIVEAHGDSFGFPSPGDGVRVEPLWAEQHADDLRLLDRRTEFADVGVMAAYPRSAFVAGRLITIYLRLPRELGRGTGVQRFGLIQWNGMTPSG
jgi:hypothetical protein